MTLPDPRALVEAPVRRALARLTVRGIAIVGVVVAAVLCPVAFPSLDRGSRDALAVLVPGGLIGLAAVLKLAQLVRGRTSEEARGRAWARAREVDADDASLALMTAGWVPVALAVALLFHVWPHLTDPNPAIAAAWVVLGLPPVVLAWLFVTTAWLDSCRDDLARSEGEADARFRRYWAGLRE